MRTALLLATIGLLGCGAAQPGRTHTSCTDAVPPGEQRAALPPGHAAGPLASLGWLQGVWTRREGDRCTAESWMSPRGTVLMGWSTTVEADRTVEWEHLRIGRRDGGDLFYVATPSGQTTTDFRITRNETTDIGDQLLEMENPAHDFPSRIRYRLQNATLHVRIEGADGQGREWTFERDRPCL